MAEEKPDIPIIRIEESGKGAATSTDVDKKSSPLSVEAKGLEALQEGMGEYLQKINKKKILLVGSGLTLVCAGLIVGLEACSRLLSGSEDQKDMPKLSEQYRDLLLNNPGVRDAIKKLKLGSDKEERQDALFYNYSRTIQYLKDGNSENWENLVAYLKTGDDAAFLGQMTALAMPTANCLMPNWKINVSACDLDNPGFKNLDPDNLNPQSVKKQYIDNYNAAVDRVKGAHPEYFPAIAPKMLRVNDRQIEQRQSFRKFEANTQKRMIKERRSVPYRT